MSIPLVVNGTTYNFPQVGDTGWGPVVTAWATAITNGLLQKAGGSFILLSPVDFGANYGISVLSLTSETANPASVGYLRMANADTIDWRNFANTSNLVLGVNSSDQLTFNGSPIGGTSSLPDSQIYIGNVSNVPTPQTVSGDATLTDAGVLTVTKHGTSEQLYGTNAAGTAPEFKTLQGTSNQVNVVQGVGIITLSLPQSIDTTANPTFSSLQLTDSAITSIWTATVGSVTLEMLAQQNSMLILGSAANTSGSRNWMWEVASGSNNFQLSLLNDSITGFLYQGIIQANNDGSVTLNTGNLKMASHKVTGLAQGSVAGDAIAYPITGSLMTNGTVTGTQIQTDVALAGSPTTSTQGLNTSNTTIATTAFANPANSLSSNGYQELPSGLIMQWGISTVVNPSTSLVITFPIAFPAHIFSVVTTPRYTNATTANTIVTPQIGGMTLSQFALANKDGTTGYDFTWMAVGN